MNLMNIDAHRDTENEEIDRVIKTAVQIRDLYTEKEQITEI